MATNCDIEVLKLESWALSQAPNANSSINSQKRKEKKNPQHILKRADCLTGKGNGWKTIMKPRFTRPWERHQ